MNDKEIIKALECCTDSRADCSKCPCLGAEIKDKITCEFKMTKNALDLINRLQAEIGNQSQNFKVLVSDHRCLQQSFDNLKGLYQAEKEKVESAKSKSIYFAKELQKARAEIERLEERIIEVQRCDKELIETLHKVHEEKIETAKSEAIKEFAERLKEKGCELEETGGFLLDEDDIYNLVKETVGDAE